MTRGNLGDSVINDFGDEWAKFSFLGDRDKAELSSQAALYLAPIKYFLETNKHLTIADFGAGSGRWSDFFLPHSSTLIVVEPSVGAFNVLKKRFQGEKKVILKNQKIEDCDVEDSSIDLAVSLGVIHHIPDPLSAIKSIHAKLKPRGHFLCYLYYNFENRGFVYRNLWRISNYFRLIISKLPKQIKFLVCDVIALIVYLPFAKLSKFMGLMRIETASVPLSHYKDLPFRVMRNDSLDRFGTRLEQRFSREQIKVMFKEAGFDPESIVFSEEEPFWTFSAQKS